MRKSIVFLGVVIVLSLNSCQKQGFRTKYGIFEVKDDSTVTMNGTIGGRTDNHFDKLIENYPNIKWIELEDCPGSRNDEVNLKVAKKMHDLGLNTRVYSDAEIASGAVDLFLAGNKREIESGAKIGVHSWAGGNQVPTELPLDDPAHDLYIDFYKSVGMSDSAAAAFYFFTINSAQANDIHWMTETEIEFYNMSTD